MWDGEFRLRMRHGRHGPGDDRLGKLDGSSRDGVDGSLRPDRCRHWLHRCELLRNERMLRGFQRSQSAGIRFRGGRNGHERRRLPDIGGRHGCQRLNWGLNTWGRRHLCRAEGPQLSGCNRSRGFFPGTGGCRLGKGTGGFERLDRFDRGGFQRFDLPRKRFQQGWAGRDGPALLAGVRETGDEGLSATGTEFEDRMTVGAVKPFTAARARHGRGDFRFPFAENIFRPVLELEFQFFHAALGTQRGFDEFYLDGCFVGSLVEPDESQIAGKGDDAVQNGEF
ncbi:MAG: hypothetical protein BWY66_02386 [bacterium ADurb.Bin374]|nr:MAG: hypothetical protein BWY66_02386 [bacterium ADurb.Bin374]